MKNKLALLDLGTNTFHLLIVEVIGKDISEIYRERIFVKLAEDGIERFSKRVYTRALDTISHYHSIILSHDIKPIEVQAVGTAALRRAENGPTLIEEVFGKTGIQIQLISGEREALLIAKGIQLAIGEIQQPSLIMDIGGGSTEFILLKKGKVEWAQSFQIGIGVLHNAFYKEDPIPKRDIDLVRTHLLQKCAPLLEVLEKEDIQFLIGASGSFEVVNDFLEEKENFPHYHKIDSKQFYPVYDKMLQASLAERLEFEKLPNSRAEMIGMAMILMHFALELSKAKEILISDYALKEGLIVEKCSIF